MSTSNRDHRLGVWQLTSEMQDYINPSIRCKIVFLMMVLVIVYLIDIPVLETHIE